MVFFVALAASVNLMGQAGSPGAAPYSPPKTRFGQPDLQGIWQVLNTAAWDVQDHAAQRYPGLPARFSVPAGPGVVEGNDIPYQPWALARRKPNAGQNHVSNARLMRAGSTSHQIRIAARGPTANRAAITQHIR